MKNQLKRVLREASLGGGLEAMLLDFFESYEKIPSLPANIGSLFETYIRLVKNEVCTPTQFPSFHKSERTPFDFYAFSLDMVRPLLDFTSSKVLGKENLSDINAAINRNENVILLANHQAEIDPQIISLLIESEFPKLAESMAFVAGHRVTSDPLAIPFSRGTNLFSIHSKKYIESPHELKAEKLRHNARTLSALEECLHKGGLCVFVAPSGGRDRCDEEGHIEVSPFDPSSVELFSLLANRAKIPTHIHLLALSTSKLLPPPKTVNIELGEERLVSYGPAGLFFGPSLSLDPVPKEDRQTRSEALTREIENMVAKLVFCKVSSRA